jgi:NAD(P)H-flavin reductase
MRFLPLSHTFVSKFYAYCIDPPLFDRYHAVPVMGLAIVPTRGQALFIAYIWIMNIILSAVGYNLTWPNSWYGSKTEEITAFVGNRAGVLSFANLGLVMLYSSRNNILLYLTDWSHATFLLVHRWLAFGCTVQACLHSAVWLQIYVKQSAEVHAKEAALEYWIWGVIATLALVVMLPLSLLPIRRKTYEVFLASHVVLAILSMIGCLLHIYYRFTWQWGYETWVYVAFVIWGFDRFIARPLRIFRNGFKKAYTTVIDEDYLMIHIPGVDASGVAYLYFPTLSWRFWENHPFSVAAVADQGPMREASRLGSDRASSVLFNNSEKAHHAIVSRPLANLSHDAGIIFYIRRRNGLTSRLEVYSSSHNGTLVLVESSYRPVQITISPLSTAKRCLVYPNTVFIAGGVGITALLPLLYQANASLCPLGTIKLFWGVRSEPLVLSVEELLGKSGTRTKSRAKWGHIDVAVSIGERFHLAELLELELRQNKGGTTVVVCGPAGMADDARLVVTGLARHGIAVRFSEESFSW